MLHRFAFSIILLITGLMVLGCSGGGDPVNIDPAPIPVVTGTGEDSVHSLWGLWTFACDAEAGNIEVIPVREG